MNCWMLIGPPCVGKSTWILNSRLNGYILSTDDYVQGVAISTGKTYDEVWEKTYPEAEAHLYKVVLPLAIQQGKDIVWDQTNISPRQREEKMKMIPDSYNKIGVFFHNFTEEMLLERNNRRPGKVIPVHILKSMIKNYKVPKSTEPWFVRQYYVDVQNESR